MRKLNNNAGVGIGIGIILIILLAIAGIWYGISYYNDTTYKADIGKEWLWRARATNDLGDMATYLDKCLIELEDYHGNPVWWFPKPDSDYDFIKQNIMEVRDNARNWSETLDGNDFAYQQAVRNLQETIIEIVAHVEIANGWNCSPLLVVLISYNWCWLWAVLLPVGFMIDEWLD